MNASKGWLTMRFVALRTCTVSMLSVAVVLVFLASPLPAFAEKGPVAFFPQSEHDFGTALEGNTVVHDFVIQNKGDEPLIIHRVRTG